MLATVPEVTGRADRAAGRDEQVGEEIEATDQRGQRESNDL